MFMVQKKGHTTDSVITNALNVSKVENVIKKVLMREFLVQGAKQTLKKEN